MRYGKIGDNFLKGASSEYIKIIENIKKEEKKKFKEKRKQLQKIKEDGDKEIKKDIKGGLIGVVKAEKECDVYCPICHKLLHVEAGQVIPRCCGKVMETL